MQQSLLSEITRENTEGFLMHFKNILKNYFGSAHFSWIQSLNVLQHTQKEIIFCTSQQVYLDIIKRNTKKFEVVFTREFQSYFNVEKTYDIVLQGGEFLTEPAQITNISTKKNTNLNPKFTFETFISTNENLFFRSNVQSVVQQIKQGINGNFLCITGAIGNGKTHILQAIGNKICNEISVQYMTSEQFMFLYTKAIAAKNIAPFREIVMETKVLLIDDLHFILTKMGTMKELASVIRYIISFGGNVVMTSAAPLHTMKGLPQEVTDTFAKASITNIENPSFNLRCEILAYKNKAFSYNVSNEVLTMLAQRITSSIRELEHTFDKIVLHSQILNNVIDTDAASMILKEIFPTAAFKHVSIKTIIEVVCKFYNISKEDILCQSRVKNIANARQIGMFLSSEMTNETMKKIGCEFGGRTHSTVIHSCKTVKELQDCDSEIQQAIETIKSMIYSEK
jgi:chromosomal replication initiator protein